MIPELPSPDTEVILTTARWGEPLGWREALMFTARRRYRLKQVPTVFTIVHATPRQFDAGMKLAEEVLKQAPGLAEMERNAWQARTTEPVSSG